MAKLVYSDQGEELEFILDGSRSSYTIGRNPMCDLRINNPSISRKHAELRLDASSGRFSIYDLNSSNGTYVNGKRESSAGLRDGDELLCGEFKLLFIDHDDADDAPDVEELTPYEEPAPAAPSAAEPPAEEPPARFAPDDSEPGDAPAETGMDRPVADEPDQDDLADELDALRNELESVRASLANETARADEAADESEQLRKAVDNLTARNAELQSAIDDLGTELRALLSANEDLLARIDGLT